MVIWVMKIFFVWSSVYSCYLFLIPSASVRSIPFLFLYCAHLCMKCSLGISNFLEDISSLYPSVVSLYFLALITEEGFFFLNLCFSLELCIQMSISFLFSLKNSKKNMDCYRLINLSTSYLGSPKLSLLQNNIK